MRYGLLLSPGDASTGSSDGGCGSPPPRHTAGLGDPLRPGELKALGAAVRELRARRGLSQEQLGVRGRLHRNYVGGIERGGLNITFRVLLKVARGLNVPLSELIEMYERNRKAPPFLR